MKKEKKIVGVIRTEDMVPACIILWQEKGSDLVNITSVFGSDIHAGIVKLEAKQKVKDGCPKEQKNTKQNATKKRTNKQS